MFWSSLSLDLYNILRKKPRPGKIYLGFSSWACITINWELVQSSFLGPGSIYSDSEILQQDWWPCISNKHSPRDSEISLSHFTLKNIDRLAQADPVSSLRGWAKKVLFLHIGVSEASVCSCPSWISKGEAKVSTVSQTYLSTKSFICGGLVFHRA